MIESMFIIVIVLVVVIGGIIIYLVINDNETKDCLSNLYIDDARIGERISFLNDRLNVIENNRRPKKRRDELVSKEKRK